MSGRDRREGLQSFCHGHALSGWRSRRTGVRITKKATLSDGLNP